MPTSEAALTAYLGQSKFSDPSAWLQRGLNPSSADVRARMETVVDAVARSALTACQRGATPADTKRAVVLPLRSVKSIEFDTEEREWICAEVAKIAKLIGVSVSHELNTWLQDYGWIVCRCNDCGHLNLLRLGPGIKGSRSVGFKFVRQLRLEEHTPESAAAELLAMQEAESQGGRGRAP